jgi:hypothetical protein
VTTLTGDDAAFRDALRGLRRGDFSRLEPLFAGDRPSIVKWHEEGRFQDEPQALAEALTGACFLGRTKVAEYLLAWRRSIGGRRHGPQRSSLGREPWTIGRRPFAASPQGTGRGPQQVWKHGPRYCRMVGGPRAQAQSPSDHRGVARCRCARRRGGLSHRQSARRCSLAAPRRWGARAKKPVTDLPASGRSHRWGQELLQYVIILLQLAIAVKGKKQNELQ